jgi:two-component system chemotaxis sensor kinase CheA
VLLRVGDETYAIPSTVVGRMVTLPRASVFTAESRDMVVIDGQPMPLVALADVLSLPAAARADDALVAALVLHAADRTVAFEVDDLASERELVLKPLGAEIARARFVSGAALLGTGAVIVVLDANDLVRAATGSAITRRWLPDEAAAQAPAVRRLRVLVVDDSITTRTLEKNILETAGLDVTVAIDGVEGWMRLNEADYDVVISDVEMPNMNGLDLTRQIKNSGHTRDIPVILLTSLAKPEQQQAGLQAGADAYLIKSQFDQGELLKMIWAVV